MSRTATQLAGNASSIFQAWLDLKQQTGANQRNVTRKKAASANQQPGRGSSA